MIAVTDRISGSRPWLHWKTRKLIIYDFLVITKTHSIRKQNSQFKELWVGRRIPSSWTAEFSCYKLSNASHNLTRTKYILDAGILLIRARINLCLRPFLYGMLQLFLRSRITQSMNWSIGRHFIKHKTRICT